MWNSGGMVTSITNHRKSLVCSRRQLNLIFNIIVISHQCSLILRFSCRLSNSLTKLSKWISCAYALSIDSRAMLLSLSLDAAFLRNAVTSCLKHISRMKRWWQEGSQNLYKHSNTILQGHKKERISSSVMGCSDSFNNNFFNGGIPWCKSCALIWVCDCKVLQELP